MKKYGLLAAVFALCLTMSACGCNKTTAGDPTTGTTMATTPTTSATTMPTTEPTMATNIPDPTVDGNSTEDGGLTGTDTTDAIESKMRGIGGNMG